MFPPHGRLYQSRPSSAMRFKLKIGFRGSTDSTWALGSGFHQLKIDAFRLWAGILRSLCVAASVAARSL
jgi:hypothetical protein